MSKKPVVDIDLSPGSARTKWDTAPFYGHTPAEKIAAFLKDNGPSTFAQICNALPTVSKNIMRGTMARNNGKLWESNSKAAFGKKRGVKLWSLIENPENDTEIAKSWRKAHSIPGA